MLVLIFHRGFAVGWDYGISWLTVLPFGALPPSFRMRHNTDKCHTELTAAGITIAYWNDTINVGVWVTVFFVLLVLIQFFGVRGYGEGE